MNQQTRVVKKRQEGQAIVRSRLFVCVDVLVEELNSLHVLAPIIGQNTQTRGGLERKQAGGGSGWRTAHWRMPEADRPELQSISHACTRSRYSCSSSRRSSRGKEEEEEEQQQQ